MTAQMYAEVLANTVRQTVQDGERIITADGTQYPANFPKSQIPNVVAVSATPQPTDPTVTVTGHTTDLINGVPTQVWQTVPIPVATARATKVAQLRQQRDAVIEGGFPATINGSPTAVTLSAKDQTNALMCAIVAQGAMTKAVAWAPNTTYSQLSVVLEAGDYYITFGGGKSGATAPVWPQAFDTEVVDGAVRWYRLGFIVSTTAGDTRVSTPDTVSLFESGAHFVGTQRAKCVSLEAQVAAATTTAEVQAVAWT